MMRKNQHQHHNVRPTSRDGAQSRVIRDGYSLRIRRNAIGQANGPTPFALVHTQDEAGLTWRVITGRVEKQESRSQLCHGDGVPVKKQVNPYIRRVAGIITGLEING